MIITVARKPFKGSVCTNVSAHHCGGLNINSSRIRDGSETNEAPPEYIPNYENEVFGSGMGGGAWANTSGRWPANVLISHLLWDLFLRFGFSCIYWIFIHSL